MTDELHPSTFKVAPECETLDLPEVAARLGVSRTSIYRWAKDGTVPTIRLGRRLLVPRAVVEELLDPHGGAQTSEAPDLRSEDG